MKVLGTLIISAIIFFSSGCTSSSSRLDNNNPILPGVRENIIGKTAIDDNEYGSYLFHLPESAVIVGNDIYISETFNNVIKKMSDFDQITVVAGTGLKGYNGDGKAKEVMLSGPTGILQDGDSIIFVDAQNYLLRKLNLSDNTIETIAGIQGSNGFPENGALASGTSIEYPYALTRKSSTEILVPMTYIPTRELRLYILRDGRFYSVPLPVELKYGQCKGIVTEGDYIYMNVLVPNGSNGDKFFFKIDYNGNLIQKYDVRGVFGGGMTRLRNTSKFIYGIGTAIDYIDENTGEQGGYSGGYYGNVTEILPLSEGYIVVDSDKGKLINITENGGFIKENGDQESLIPKSLIDGTVYDEENILFLDNRGGRIYNFNTKTSKVTVFAGNGKLEQTKEGDKFNTGFWYPTNIAVDSNKNVYFNENHRILKIDTGGQITVFSGDVQHGDVSNTRRETARYKSIRGLSFSPNDTLYVSDTYNDKIKAIYPNGFVQTILSDLNRPHGVEVMSDTELKICDSWSNYVITYDFISTQQFAGIKNKTVYQGYGGDSGDGGSAKDARLNTPHRTVTIDRGTYILDTFNNKIKFVNKNSEVINTAFGDGVQGYSENSFNLPTNMFYHNGYLYVTDTGNGLVSRFFLN